MSYFLQHHLLHKRADGNMMYQNTWKSGPPHLYNSNHFLILISGLGMKKTQVTRLEDFCAEKLSSWCRIHTPKNKNYLDKRAKDVPQNLEKWPACGPPNLLFPDFWS